MTDSLWRKRQEPERSMKVEGPLHVVCQCDQCKAQPEPYDQTALELCNVCGWKTLIPDDACLNCERAQPEQEQIALWLEKECDEQYLADRVRAGDYAKEKGHTENCAALADDIGKRHLPPSPVGIGESNSTAQPEQEYHAVNAVHKGQQCYVKAQPQQEPTKQEHNILMGALKRSGKVVAQTEHHTLTSRVNDVRLHKERDEQRAEAMKMLAQPQQEPVALQMDVIVVNLVREGINKHRARELAEHFIKHTTPPQRTWVELTDEEYVEACQMAERGNYLVAFQRIQAKLRSKNG